MQTAKKSPDFLCLKEGLVLLTACIALFFSSCNDEKGKTTVVTSPICVTFTRAGLETWVKKGYTKPGSADQIVYLQFLTSYGGLGTSFSVSAQGLRNDYSVVTGSLIPLTPGSSCPVTLPSSIAIGSNSVKLSDINILDAGTGSLKTDFKLLKLTPQSFPENPMFMNYSMEEEKNDGSTSAKEGSLPCPPCIYCKPACDSTISD